MFIFFSYQIDPSLVMFKLTSLLYWSLLDSGLADTAIVNSAMVLWQSHHALIFVFCVPLRQTATIADMNHFARCDPCVQVSSLPVTYLIHCRRQSTMALPEIGGERLTNGTI